MRPPSFFVPASGVTPEFDLLEPTSDGAYRKRRLEDTRVLEYTGPVYNIEVEEDQTYLVQGAAVHNCQNWLTSQALRDPEAVVRSAGDDRRASWPRWRGGTARAS